MNDYDFPEPPRLPSRWVVLSAIVICSMSLIGLMAHVAREDQRSRITDACYAERLAQPTRTQQWVENCITLNMEKFDNGTTR